ncbi:hypothetical protein Skr01_41400 [Sphaerisporangium krabiense]|uniref:Glyoxalase-like domain-containing protein n=1 Tax=Sphaerisporangium krabiense TaxID=763782 RepID=A0A7W9DNH6_9ACTN|nr:VOC family protein [Sphaerisporangium krabiense]MBB5625431.1 hypothetical protein [Sphaerisporangium krabiense]GII64055.1 hypothetical protein Skr01_41400 [Sphaerisporangium krabiense]
MPHYSRIYKAVVDVPEEVHDAELKFWEGATGQALHHNERYPEYHGAQLPGEAFALLVQKLGEGPGGLHLDIHTDDLDAEVARLESLGATRVSHVNGHWWVMRDPAGLLFCVIPDRSGTLNDSNAQRWD